MGGVVKGMHFDIYYVALTLYFKGYSFATSSLHYVLNFIAYMYVSSSILGLVKDVPFRTM